jgi:hypothetical protein
MDLLQNQHLDTEVAQKADCGPLKLDCRGARVLRRAENEAASVVDASGR